MRKASLFDWIGMFLAIIGAVILVITFLPVINPALLGREHYRDGMMSRNYFGILVATIVLGTSWYFNKKAQRLRRETQPSAGGNAAAPRASA